jgi:hypothetical protein
MNVRRCPHVTPEVEEAARRLTDFQARKGFHLAHIHQYTRPDGSPWWWVVRLESSEPDPTTWEKPKKPKNIWPMRRTENGFEMKRPEFGPQGAPLYNRHLLTNYRTEWVWIPEGEKCGDWLSATLDTATVLSWAGGAASVDRTDWNPLAGQCIVLWPDFDRGGFEAMRKIQAILRALGCFVLVLDVAALDLPPKGDAVDFLERFRDQYTGLVNHDAARARLAEVAFLHDVPEWRAAA